MNTKLYLFIAMRIVILFSTAMVATFLPEHLREFFGDVQIPEISGFGIDNGWTWGARHYWFWWMMFFLFTLSVIDFIVAVVRAVIKHHPEIK